MNTVLEKTWAGFLTSPRAAVKNWPPGPDLCTHFSPGSYPDKIQVEAWLSFARALNTNICPAGLRFPSLTVEVTYLKAKMLQGELRKWEDSKTFWPCRMKIILSDCWQGNSNLPCLPAKPFPGSIRLKTAKYFSERRKSL